MTIKPDLSSWVPTIRCGTDLVEIDRIHRAVTRLGRPFLERVFTKSEQWDCMGDGDLTKAAAASLAVRFAAKEAVGKALGTGIWRQGVNWTDIAIKKTSSGAPEVVLTAGALAAFESLGGLSLAVSLSHERHMALAFCVLTCRSSDLEAANA